MSLFEQFVTEVSEKADELAKGGAMKNTGQMVHASFAVCGEWKDCDELKSESPVGCVSQQ